MKYKTTQKAIRNNYNTIISLSYCAAQNLLNFENPTAYTCGVYGWNADIYDLGEGVAIVTGYRPFGNVKPNYDKVKEYEDRAEKIRYNNSLTWQEQKEQLKQLITEFVKEVKSA